MSHASLIIKGTRLCNLRCTYCNDWRVGKDQTMSFPVMSRTIAAALRDPDHKLVQFIWHGGETTVLPQTFYEKALLVQARFRRHDQRVRNVIQTNGTRLTPEWARFFRANRFAVGISLDGPPEIHDRYRRYASGRPSFQDVARGIKLLRECNVPLSVLMVIDEGALDVGPDRVFDFFVEHEIKNFGLLAAKPTNQPDAKPGTPTGHYTDIDTMMAFLARMYDRWREHGDPEVRIRELDGLRARLRGGGGFCTLAGGCLGQYFVVEPNGDVAHCDNFLGDRRYTLGNIMMHDFEQLRVSPNLLALQAENEQAVDAMRGCPEFAVCNGWCPHERYTSLRHNLRHRRDCCGLRPLIEHIRARMPKEEEQDCRAPVVVTKVPDALPRKRRVLDIVIGPSSDLHPGVHGALLGAPPPGVAYRLARCRRAFTFSPRPGDDRETPSALDRFATDEAVWFEGAEHADLVHVHHLPLVGGAPWIVETDDLLVTLKVGRLLPVASPEFRLADLDDELIRRRERTLLARFCSRQCAAVVFRTNFGRTLALHHVEERRLADPETRAALEAKSFVVYPTLPAPAPRPKQERLRVLFSGRSDRKGGDVALAAFAELAELLEDDVELVYVGDPPDAPVHDAVSVLPLKERTSYLAELDRAHVFVSPTEFESYGMALVEAAAHGLALVTTRGRGMEHIEELFAEGENVLYIDTAWTFKRRVRAVRDHVLRLARDRALLAAISERNRALVGRGKLSVEQRNASLMAVYERCATASRSVAVAWPKILLDERTCSAALKQRVGNRHLAVLI